MDALVLALNEDAGNIQQRVFDAFPALPGMTTIDALATALPFARWSIIKALERLSALDIVELAPRNVCCVYRLVKGARRPIDMRGHHGNSGRRPRAA